MTSSMVSSSSFQVVPPCGGHPTPWRRSSPTTSGFKSCPRVGGIQNVRSLRRRWRVSSRAPVWGASLRRYWSTVSEKMVFQVVPPCGGHLASYVLAFRDQQFQVVPPCGGHPCPACGCLIPEEFQVVPPCGGHPQGQQEGHRPLQGFKSCPRVGGISCDSAEICNQSSFKSCPRVGGIRATLIAILVLSVSSRAPVWGASQPDRSDFAKAVVVSSRAPVWGAS